MIATLRLTTRMTLLGIATVCASIGCTEVKSPAKQPAAATPAVTSKDSFKQEPSQVAVTPKDTVKQASSQAAVTPKEKAKQEPAAAAKAPADESKGEAAEILANRAKLSPEDRKLVEAQEWCVINNDDRLGGEMGMPIKLMIKGRARISFAARVAKRKRKPTPIRRWPK